MMLLHHSFILRDRANHVAQEGNKGGTQNHDTDLALSGTFNLLPKDHKLKEHTNSARVQPSTDFAMGKRR